MGTFNNIQEKTFIKPVQKHKLRQTKQKGATIAFGVFATSRLEINVRAVTNPFRELVGNSPVSKAL